MFPAFREPDPLEISSDEESKPSTSTGSTLRRVDKYKTPDRSKCKFYRNRQRKDGTWVFHKKLLKYFMKLDSPDYHDLKNKRFNTSFLKEKQRGRRDIEIFTKEELLTPIIPFPEIKVNVTDRAPGEKYADVFKSIHALSPVELDEDIKKMIENHKKLKRDRKLLKKTTGKAIRTSRIGKVTYNGKPIPDEALITDYTGLFDSKFFSHHSAKDTDPAVGKSEHKTENGMLLSPLNRPSGDNSASSCGIGSSENTTLRNDPRRYDWIEGLYDEGRLHGEEEMPVNQYESGVANRTPNDMFKRLSRDKVAHCNRKRKPKSAVTRNRKSKPRLRKSSGWMS